MFHYFLNQNHNSRLWGNSRAYSAFFHISHADYILILFVCNFVLKAKINFFGSKIIRLCFSFLFYLVSEIEIVFMWFLGIIEVVEMVEVSCWVHWRKKETSLFDLKLFLKHVFQVTLIVQMNDRFWLPFFSDWLVRLQQLQSYIVIEVSLWFKNIIICQKVKKSF